LIATGLYNSSNILSRPQFLLSTNYGIILVIKIILVISLIVMFIIHVRIIRSEIEKKIESKQMLPEIVNRLRSKIISLGRIMVFVSVAILLMAALLRSGI